MTRKAVFFPHSDKEFDDEYDLRDWLAGGLRIDRDGRYRLRAASGLGQLEKGSVVFFFKNNRVVGLAVVEEDLKDITDQVRQRFDWTSSEEKVYKKFVKFFSNSIWAFADKQFIDTARITKITGKSFGQGFPMIDDLDQLMEVLAILNP